MIGSLGNQVWKPLILSSILVVPHLKEKQEQLDSTILNL